MGLVLNIHINVLSYAAWGVLSATDGDLVAIGHLSGITPVHRSAELTAILAALRWSTSADICIWSDSLSCVNLADYVQQHEHVPINVEELRPMVGSSGCLALACRVHHHV